MWGEITQEVIFSIMVFEITLYDFIAECWISEPSERPTFIELVQTIDAHLVSSCYHG